MIVLGCWLLGFSFPVPVFGVSLLHIVPFRREQIVASHGGEKAAADGLWVNVHRAASLAV
jgi:hypothetical protein